MALPRPKKHLSQNFLSDPSILARIIGAANVTKDDTVVEIGPGPGAMTAMLTERAGRVVAIEYDRELYAHLRDTFETTPNLDLIAADAMRFPFDSIGVPFKVVANIPYHITSPLMFRLIESGAEIISMTLTVQREVAERIVAHPGTKEYGAMSVMVALHGEASLRFVIPAGAFRPKPKVDSACLHIDMTRNRLSETGDPARFRAIVKAAFSQRRKTLHNSLRAAIEEPDRALRAAGVDPVRRAETLSLDDFLRIAGAA